MVSPPVFAVGLRVSGTLFTPVFKLHSGLRPGVRQYIENGRRWHIWLGEFGTSTTCADGGRDECSTVSWRTTAALKILYVKNIFSFRYKKTKGMQTKGKGREIGGFPSSAGYLSVVLDTNPALEEKTLVLDTNPALEEK